MRFIRNPRARSAAIAAFTLVEILISILILALGLLGLGVLFPVLIREQRIGADATLGVGASNNARAVLARSYWGGALAPSGTTPHPYSQTDPAQSTEFLWNALRDPRRFEIPRPFGPTTEICLGQGFDPRRPLGSGFQPHSQGEWLASLIDGPSGAVYLGFPRIAGGQTGQVSIYDGVSRTNQPYNGFVTLSVRQRVFPMSENPTFVWDFAVQRVSSFDHSRDPRNDPVRAVVFVRRIDPRIRLTGGANLLDAISSTTLPPSAQRVPVAEDENGSPTLDGIGTATGGVSPNYSPIHTAEVEFWYDSPTGQYTHRDRLYAPVQQAATPTPTAARLKVEWALMRQPGQKLVDNMGNIYTVVGSGNEGAFARDVDGDGLSDYVKIDPPVPDSVTAQRASPWPAATGTGYTNSTSGTNVSRALWQVAFTPQIPVSVTLVELAGGKGQ